VTVSEPSAAFTGALANEQFVLQSVAGASISESGSRAALYFSALSSGLVAVGFASSSRGALAALAFTVLPTVGLLGALTVVRLVDTSVENLVALRRIERIRRYWSTLDPAGEEYFAVDDPALGHHGVRYGAWALLFTMASMVALINAVLVGAVVALFLALALAVPALVATLVGVLAGLAATAIGLVYEQRRLRPLVAGSAGGGRR
jgi:hypothetical protein